jgi:hypothetical protein
VRYGKTDGRIEFSASNRCIYPLEGSSDRRWRNLRKKFFKNREIGDVFASALRTGRDRGNWMAPFDSPHKIGVSTLSREVLTEAEGVRSPNFKNREFGNVFASALSTSGRTGKWMAPFDSAYKIGPTTLSKEVLTADEGVCGWRFENWEIRYVFNYCERTDGGTGEWMAPVDSAQRIGLSLIWRGVLTVDEGVCGWRCKNCGIRYVFNYCETTTRDTDKRMVG